MEFLSLRRRRSSWQNVPSGEEQGETAILAVYKLSPSAGYLQKPAYGSKPSTR